MRRFDAIWKYSGSYSDQTLVLGEGTSSVTLSAGETLYFGLNDWFSGVLTFLSTVPSPAPVYVVEQFDGDTWRTLPLEESIINQQEGVQLQRGSFYWGISPWQWNELVFSATTPESSGSPPDTFARFWVRLRVTSGTITIDRVLPQLYNTYASIEELENYIGYSFSDVSVPTRETVRKMLRGNEDWLDQYCRRSWRPRIAYNETYDFNAYGFRLRRYPAWFIISVGLWNGSNFETLVEGRGKDYFLDSNTGMLRFLLPSYRLRYYSFLLSRYMRQPASMMVTYAYGEDFETSRYAEDVKRIVLMKTGADLVNQSDWTTVFTRGGDSIPPEAKMKEWAEEARHRADELRMPLIN